MTKVYLQFEIGPESFYRVLDHPETTSHIHQVFIGAEYYITPFHSIFVTNGQAPRLNVLSPEDTPFSVKVGSEYRMILNDQIDNDLPEQGTEYDELKVGDVITITEINDFVKVTQITVKKIVP